MRGRKKKQSTRGDNVRLQCFSDEGKEVHGTNSSELHPDLGYMIAEDKQLVSMVDVSQQNYHINKATTGVDHEPEDGTENIVCNKRHICSYCDKGFKWKGDLNKHIRIHTGQKPYVCSTCGKGFAQVTHMKRHQRIHSGEKPYKCDICCKTFSVKSHVDQHIRIHTGDRPYSCEVCGKTFNRSNIQKQHSTYCSGFKLT